MKSLKEWATVISALEHGEQTVLIRKGGILEVASGFRVESNKFLLFPTAEHQGHANIKEQFHDRLEQVRTNTPKSGYNRITSYAKVLAEVDIDSLETVAKLSKFHIWNQSYVDNRMKWMEEKPIKALFLKVYVIPELLICMKSEYRGCKSWLEINEDFPEGKQVLSDAEIESRLAEFRSIVS